MSSTKDGVEKANEMLSTIFQCRVKVGRRRASLCVSKAIRRSEVAIWLGLIEHIT